MKVKYDNKSILNVHDITNYDKDSLHGKRIIGIMSNKFYDVSYVYKYENDDGVNYLNLFFSKEKYEAFDYLYTNSKNNKSVDKNHIIHSKVPEYVKAIEEQSISVFFEGRFSFKTLGYYEYILPVDEIKITIDHDDVKQEVNTLNLLTYDKNCDYYTKSFALYINQYDQLDVLNMFQFDDNEEWYNVNLTDWNHIKNENIKYINFFSNIDFQFEGKSIL